MIACRLKNMNYLLQKALLVALFGVALSLLSTVTVAKTYSDKIVVIVNDDVITEGELQLRIKRVKANNQLTNIDGSIRQRILKNMVEELVQLQRAEQLRITTSEPEIDRLEERFARQQKLTVEQLREQIKLQGLPYDDFRDSLRTQSTLRKLVRADAARSVSVTDEEIDTFAKANNIKPKAVAYDVSFLQVKFDENSTEAEQQALLSNVERAKSQLKTFDFQSFKSVLETQNIVPEISDLGVRQAEQLPELFNKSLSKIQAGQYSDLLKTSSGIYVLRLNAVQGGVAVTERRKAQHILIAASSKLEVQRAEKIAARLKSQIEAGADFANVAKYYSDDATSAAKGGDLGWVRKGQTVPNFESTLFAIQTEGQISAPIVTNFGVHIIKLNEIAKSSDPEEEMKAVAYNNLMTQKVDQYYPVFLSKLIGRAYIKYL